MMIDSPFTEISFSTSFVDFTAAACRSRLLPVGVSVDSAINSGFAPLPGFSWYVLRVAYGKELPAAEKLASLGYMAYVPAKTITTQAEDSKVVKKESRLLNALFLYAHSSEIGEFKQLVLPLSGKVAPAHISLRYDHTRKTPRGLEPIMTVPFAEMLNFIRLIQTEDEHIALYPENLKNANVGDWVEVTDGKFRGIRGRVSRFHHQTTVLIRLKGICIATSAYVPRSALRVLTPEEIEEISN